MSYKLDAMLQTAVGDPLGGCRVSPYGYSVMLSKVSRQVLVNINR